MNYLPEQIREAIINRIIAASSADQVFYRTPVAKYDGDPAYVLEYAETDNLWTSSASDKKTFLFNLYVVYDRTDNGTVSAEAQELAEKAISDAIGELYRVVFEKPDVLELSNGWLRASNVSWGYGGSGDDLPYRMALMQLEVTVHEDRSA